MKKRIGHKLLPLSRRLTPTQKKRRAKRIARHETRDSYEEK